MRGRRRRPGRPRPLREVLPRLHAQAVAAATRRELARERHRAHPDAHEPRRPLLHRRAPGDARRRLHRDVRPHPRPPLHRASRSRPSTRTCATRSTLRPPRVHGPDRRVLRRALRPAAVPQPRASSGQRWTRRAAASSSRSRQVNFPDEDVPYTRITEFRHLPAGDTGSSSTVAVRVPGGEGDPYYPIPRPENRALYKRYAGRRPTRSRRHVRRPTGPLPVPQHGSGRRAGARHVRVPRRADCRSGRHPDAHRRLSHGMQIFTASPESPAQEKLFVWKRAGDLCALDLRGYETRNPSVLKLIALAEQTSRAPHVWTIARPHGRPPDQHWRSDVALARVFLRGGLSRHRGPGSPL